MVVCLSRLCRSKIGDRCGFMGILFGFDEGDAPGITAELQCSTPEQECPGMFLIEDAANEAIAELNDEHNRNN